MTTISNTRLTADGSRMVTIVSGPFHSSRKSVDMPCVHVRKAFAMIHLSKQKIKALELPDNFQINEMSELASKLIELGLVVMAGRVDLALYSWLELDADA
tara:strand:+ start:128 stop:427 length:300 start_codon:yes stop_codon:yes gene_type:complete